ncbi:MAG: hypothetical protein JSR76_04840 [Verrucomicrobia bacterium]|nr:hypothetical protein [Verrucomicrobiota bacterium]
MFASMEKACRTYHGNCQNHIQTGENGLRSLEEAFACLYSQALTSLDF